ncbi:MAG: hypothetical protein GX856_00990 [Gammaproteobacteria bacterium]|nr:hypothetical protein [Gammaproteobacteria bacterium]
MLPEGFSWANRHQYDTRQTALVLDGRQVAMLLERIDGTWFARLECHWPITAPLVTRRCRSLDAGRAGIEAWAVRHQARLRAEVRTGRREGVGEFSGE